MKREGGKRQREARREVVLVFGESENDRRAIQHLVVALRPDLEGAVEPRRSPLVLIKGALPKKQKSNAAEIASIAKLEQRTRSVRAVLAHQDCDAVEPAQVSVSHAIESALSSAGCPGAVIAVTPAWEVEAWWMVFPEAVKKVCQAWREPRNWVGKDVGKVTNAKEKLAQAVQTGGAAAKTKREYRESDSIDIAQNIANQNLLREFSGGSRKHQDAAGKIVATRSASLEQFRLKVLAI